MNTFFCVKCKNSLYDTARVVPNEEALQLRCDVCGTQYLVQITQTSVTPPDIKRVGKKSVKKSPKVTKLQKNIRGILTPADFIALCKKLDASS